MYDYSNGRNAILPIRCFIFGYSSDLTVLVVKGNFVRVRSCRPSTSSCKWPTLLARKFSVTMGKISGTKVTAWWFNSRTGTTQSFGTFDNTDVKEFTCPSEGFGSDWVLVLDDASRNFITPGSSVAR